MAKKAVDSTFKKILTYTTEIIGSIILLVVICIPMAAAVPSWIQHVLFGTPTSEVLINPVAFFGVDGTVLFTIGLAVVAFILGYPMTMKLLPGIAEEKTSDEIETDLEDTEEPKEDITEDVSPEKASEEPNEDEEESE